MDVEAERDVWRYSEKFKGCFVYCYKFAFFKSKNIFCNRDETTVFLRKQAGFSHLCIKT